MATLEAIRARIAKLEAQAASVAARQSSGVLQKIHDLMKKHGLVISDIEAHVGKKRGRKSSAPSTDAHSVVAAKYRDPKTGATWSGRGRAPAWIASTKDRTKFEVNANSDAPVTKTKPVAKAGNYVRGPQPALYRDPKSGATWSGRGRAPAWIANAKNRDKFLIAKVVDSTTSSASAGKAPAKKASAAKKAATKNAEKKGGRTGAAAENVTAKKVATKKVAAKKVATKKAATKKVRAKNVETNTVAPSAVVEHINGAVAPQSEE